MSETKEKTYRDDLNPGLEAILSTIISSELSASTAWAGSGYWKGTFRIHLQNQHERVKKVKRGTLLPNSQTGDNKNS